MEKPTPRILLISLFLLSVSTAGGALIARKLGGSSAGYQSFFAGSSVAAAIFITQLAIYLSIRERLFFTIVFLAAFCMTFVWFMFCLFAPILWIEPMPRYAKLIAVLVFFALCVSNFRKGLRDFSRNWAALRDPLALGKFNRTKGTITWEKVQRALRHQVDFYIPGLSMGISMAVGVVALVFMLIGLNLRAAFPVFSAFAWGIPCAMMSSMFFQLMSYRLAEAKKIRDIQADLGIDLKMT